MTELDLRETLERRLGGLDVPPADPAISVVRGRRRRHRRQALTAVCVAASLAAVASGGFLLLSSEPPGRGVDPSGTVSLGALSFADGARAYADPGREVHLGGRTFPADDLAFLDTDAVATQYGIVYYAAGRPMLLGADGTTHPLAEGDLDRAGGFHPTAKADSTHPWVAFATRQGGTTTLTVRDLAADRDVASTTVDCGACTDLVIDAFDDGVAYVRTGSGTRTWDSATDTWRDFAGPVTRVADVRGGVVLYDGPAPTDLVDAAGRRLRGVEGPIDATLTFDGDYVLSWSSRLKSTDGRPDLVLDQGPVKGLGFWAIDSDGSVLVARPQGGYPDFLVYDCAVPSGACEELGPLVTKNGDPSFIGNDM